MRPLLAAATLRLVALPTAPAGAAYVVSADDAELAYPAGATLGTSGNDTFNGTDIRLSIEGPNTRC